MPEYSITTGRPRFAAVIRTRQPYVLFEQKLESAYTVRVRYLSLNKGTDASGGTEVLNFTSRTEIPILPQQYHRLVLLCAGKFIAGELKDLRDPNGNLRYPGLAGAYEYFATEYESQLVKDKELATRRVITRTQQGFSFAGAEYDGLYW